MSLRVGGFETQQSVWVADITDQCILGLDFLEANRCQVDLVERVLHVGGQQIPLYKPCTGSPAKCYRVIASGEVTVPAGTEMIVPGQLVGEPLHSAWGIVESSRTELLVGKTLVNLSHTEVPVRVLNVSEYPRHYKRGADLAACSPVTSVAGHSGRPEGDDATDKLRCTQLPDFLNHLYYRSVANLPERQKAAVYDLLCSYADVFSQGPDDLGRTNLVEHRVHTGDSTPIRQPPRRLPPIKQEAANKAIQEMLDQGLIEPASSPWASPIVLARKKDGSWRFCVDYRKLNDATRKDSYPLPRIDDTLDRLGGMQLFSTLDLRSGYWQVEMEEGDKEKTAFVTDRGLWQFNVMPFGLCNAPATFERLMDRVLAGLPPEVAMVYIDDILVSGKTFEDQIKHLEQVFQRLRNASLKLSPDKCQLLQQQVKYLGHIISHMGVSTDPEKVEAVQSWPAPSSITEVKQFLGLCSYYRRFIHHFADIAAPMHRLLGERQQYEWTPEADRAFRRLKQALVEAPVLSYPRPEGKAGAGHRRKQPCHRCSVVTNARWPGEGVGLLQPGAQPTRATVLCHPKGVAGRGQSHPSVPQLLVWAPLCRPHRPRGSEMVTELPQPRGTSGTLASTVARIQLYCGTPTGPEALKRRRPVPTTLPTEPLWTL